MKITIARTNKQKRLCISTKNMEQLMERIAKGDTGRHRQYVYPAAEFGKDANDNLSFIRMNGIVLLTFANLKSEFSLSEAKKAASMMPTTLAAMTGADGKSLIVLVSITDSHGTLPCHESEAEQLYDTAYGQAATIYNALLKGDTENGEVSLRANFALTHDAEPYYNGAATPMRIQSLSPTIESHRHSDDLKAFNDNAFIYRKAAADTANEMDETQMRWENDEERLCAYISRLSARLCSMGLSEEETFTHVRRNHWHRFQEESLRQLVETAYDGIEKNKRRIGSAKDTKRGRNSILKMMRLLNDRYVFRYNEVMKVTEYRPNNSWVGDFQPVDGAAQKGMTLEVQLEDIQVSIKDVRNFLESNRIRRFNPIADFLYDCLGKWDGKDRIRALARTVPTSNPLWEDWFYTWFLAMVRQWRGVHHATYGNSAVPLLISEQGYNKSTFCRRLIPDCLSWGYNDNLVLSEKRQVLQAMSQFLLINLDEFNQISPQTQQGFLKNLLQLPSVKVKPPYGSHVVEFPRIASFIATSNMTDILADPSGNRRFLGVELTAPIDVSTPPNHVQLYAQAMEALQNGEKAYFDVAENEAIIQSNKQFQQVSPFTQCFFELFEPTDDHEKGTYMSATSIFAILRKRFGSSLQVANIQRFGRELKSIDGLRSRRVSQGTEYLVIRKQHDGN